MIPVLLDTSVVVAIFNLSELRHSECVALIDDLNSPLVTCEAVIAEACHLLRNVHGAPEAILQNVEQGSFQIPFDLANSAGEVRAIMRKYRDIPADFADACLIHLADTLGVGEILTFDTDFRTYRWRKSRPFRLLLDEH